MILFFIGPVTKTQKAYNTQQTHYKETKILGTISYRIANSKTVLMCVTENRRILAALHAQQILLQQRPFLCNLNLN
jgi:hypothetical protein